MHPFLSHHDYLSASPAHALPRHEQPRKAGTLRRWLGRAFRRWQRQRMIAAFAAMDDRLLRDIGISRSDIPRVVDSLDDRELRMVPVARAPKAAGTMDDLYRRAA
ncbi:DUF1127 domain-containing protein [Marivita sp. GX14005]|uniref:DUF1127 domain-containing protein n=1 Tax=Marivita sp. GX14005 TaxID=2942276 RepID=UPI0020190601|nr:DUF1127 domain-containing protein [Marivita sp. GX14005]MCL3883179.1 DUF1127 domain-containing protein [Marivita sp. GX14005]